MNYRNRVLIFCIIFVFLSAVAYANSFQVEDSALIEATVLGLHRDEADNAIISLSVDNILDYFHNESALYEPLDVGQDLMLGFLWGHRPVTPTDVGVEKGDRILARIGYHYNFTSHNGHVYSLEKICEQDETKVEGDCIPSECEFDEHFVNNRCEKLDCNEDAMIFEHDCVELECEPGEVAVNHECVKLECDYNEYAENHTCVKLKCEQDEKIVDHGCSKLSCNIFQRVGPQKCVLNWNVLGGILLVFVIIVFFWFDEVADKFKKTPLYKRLVRNQFYLTQLVIIFTFILLFTPSLLRMLSGHPLIFGEEPYLHAKLAMELQNGNFSLNFTPYHFLLAGFGIVFDIELASVIIPPILGVITLISFIHLLKKLKINTFRRNTILILLAISPAFIYTFTFSTPHALSVTFTLAGLNLLMKNKKVHLIAGGFLFLLASLHSLFNVVICSVIISYLIIKKKKTRALLLLILVLLLALTLPYQVMNFTFRDTVYQFQQSFVKDSITGFGALIGFSIFSLFLALFGFINTWKQKRKYALFYLMFVFVILFGLILNKNFNMYYNFVIGFLSGLGFVYLVKSKWELSLVKELTILLIVCGLLFSTVLYVKQIVIMQPNNEIIEGLEWLSGQESGIVLSHYSRGYWIEEVSKQNALVDGTFGKNTNYLLNVTEEIMYSRDLVKTNNLLNSSQIKYIFIDKEMKQGLVWTKEEEGLLFLFRNNKTFKNIYKNPEVEVWEFIGE